MKSVQHRSLLELWDRLRAGSEVARWSALQTSDVAAFFDYMIFIDVLRNDANLRFQITARGQYIGQMFAGDCQLKFLDEVIPADGLAAALEGYHQVVRRKLPVYTISEKIDDRGTPISYERLLLPFTSERDVVTQIVGLLQPVGLLSKFDHKQLFTFKFADAFSIKATINPQL